MANVELKAIGKSFGAVRVIKGIDLEIDHGEFVVFVGPSGCGKSTLLRMIAGIEDISDGDLLIDSLRCNDIAPRDRGIAMVFQSYALYPHMTVYDNIGFSLKLASLPKAERDQKINEAAQLLQLEELLDRKPAQLSGGQRQRVAIGRAIVRQPKVFLFDEPLSNLDAALRVDMRMGIAQLHQDLGATMIYVTHDQIEAMTLADKIVVLDQGMVMQVGAPLELYHRPANLFVAGFIGSPKMNFLEVSVTNAAGGGVSVSSPVLEETHFTDTHTSDRALVLGVRPQSMRLTSPDDGRMTAEVVLVERLGDETVINARLADGKSILVVAPGDAEVAPRDRVGLTFDPNEAHLFQKSGERVDHVAMAAE